MTKKDDVELFLKNFKTKLGIWNIAYLDGRPKNTQTLADLEIPPYKRTEVVKSLEIPNYSEGPIEEKMLGGSEMWVFGKKVKKKEIYIKITMGIPNNAVICISFHIAEHKMKYPFN